MNNRKSFKKNQHPNSSSRSHSSSATKSSSRSEIKDSRRIVIGIHAAREVLKVRPHKVSEIWIKEGAEKIHDLAYFLDFALNKRIKLLKKNDASLDKIASSHQGICLFVDETPQLKLEEIAGAPEDKVILLALDEITDPHNVGAALRTAWLFGVKGILVPENRSAHLTPAAIKVASGGSEHVPLYVCKNLANDLSYLKDKGFWIYGLDAAATNDLTMTKFNEKVVLVVGAEDKGIRSTTANECDELVSISQTQKEASFNASVAAALVMYEVVRQHKKPEKFQ